MNMKKILFLSSKGGQNSNVSQLEPALSPLLNEDSIKIDTDTYSNLEYAIVDQKASIFSSKNAMDIKDYDLVIPLSWRRTPEQATACMTYLKKMKTRIIQGDITNFRSTSKVTEYFKIWEVGAPIPNTIYSKNPTIIKMLKREHLKFPLIVKDAFKHKGDYNFLVTNLDQVKEIITKHKGRRFVFQEFIPNNFDYRIITFGYKPQLAFKRQRSKDSDSHLNNTTLGATATKVPLEKLDPQILKEVENICKSMKRSIAGADVLIDSETKKHYFLEVNYAPQLRTGSFVKEKMKLYADYLKSELKNK